MSLARIILKSLRQHLLSTLVTAFSIALAGGLLMAVWVIRDQSRQAFTQMDGGFDAVLGTRSSPLQLVLNSVFHLENSPGNIKISELENLRKNPSVALAVPLSVGDSYKGYRIVGTTLDLFQKAEYAPGKKHSPQGEGRFFDERLREAVVGSFVAQRLGLRPGDHFHPAHGVAAGGEEHHHDDEYVVVGILKPSNTPADRVIWIPLEGLQYMSGHKEESHDEISAILLKFRTPIAGKLLQSQIDRGTQFTLAWPIGTVVAQLFDKVRWVDKVLELVAYLVALVATGSILASIYNSMNERRREIAILRALGAGRGLVFGAIVLEAAAIATLGMLFSFVVYLAILGPVAAAVQAQTGVVLAPFVFHPIMWMAPVGMILAGALAGMIPAWKAYETDVAENLVPMS